MEEIKGKTIVMVSVEELQEIVNKGISDHIDRIIEAAYQRVKDEERRPIYLHDIAQMTGRHFNTIRNMMDDGRLPYYKLGKFRASDLGDVKRVFKL